MAVLGAHQSIAGGYHNAVELAHRYGCDCVQLFTKNRNQWASKSITKQEVQLFRQALERFNIVSPLAHDSYLINLASPIPSLWWKSVKAFVDELHRAETLGIPAVVTHPGSSTTATEVDGLKNVARALDEIHAQTAELKVQCLLETTAGQGTSLGWRFEHFASILEQVANPDCLGFCFDTCHVFAAGYPLGKDADYQATMDRFDHLIGLDRIKAFHLNDSRRELGSRVDRHEHIGRGKMGIEPFRHILNDPRFRSIPMYLETPKEDDNGENMDVVNLRILRELATG